MRNRISQQTCIGDGRGRADGRTARIERTVNSNERHGVPLAALGLGPRVSLPHVPSHLVDDEIRGSSRKFERTRDVTRVLRGEVDPATSRGSRRANARRVFHSKD